MRGLFVALSLFAAGGAHAAPIGVADFVKLARSADVVVLGEVHDNPQHHANEAAIVSALKPAALVFEMIPQQSEAAVNELRSQGASRAEIAGALDWSRSGWPNFSYYAGILEAAPEAQIFGAEQPNEDLREAMLEGAAIPFGPDASNYGLDLPLAPREQAEREQIQAQAHCGKLPRDMLPGMVEAQRFRDAGLADAALWARTMTGGGQVVVITGTGHAAKTRGMPAAIAAAEPSVRVVSLGQFEDDPGATDPGATSEFDRYMVAPAPKRSDPCAALEAPEK